ncbi:cytochrome P450 [Thelonectria olida]|uniref:Cytochrome P450 n=1 Tax=Thelonectria olida TaxID=1576542 RepID=A0A9P8WDT9_9HYPO|nr:cytochrome P450 [Thelonectria olida]
MDGHETAPKGLDALIHNLQQPTTLAIISAVLAILLTTRLVTGGSSTFKDGSKSPPLAPHWIPILDHLPRIFFSPIFALTRLRNRYSEGLFSIRIFGHVHTFVFKPVLADSLLQQPGSVTDKRPLARRLLVSTFGLSSKDLEAYDKASAELQAASNEFLSGSHLNDLSKATFRDLNFAVADLVSFNSYPIDHADWERLANAEKVDDEIRKESTMAVDLLQLIKAFVARTANASLFGADFVENFPEIWPYFWEFDESFDTLGLNFPIWVPWLGAQRGRMALRKLLGFLREYHVAWEMQLNGENKDPRWQDFHTASPLIRARVDIFRKHALSIDARASCDLALLWSVNASSTPLISWSLLELYRDPVLLEQVREEIAPFAQILQPTHEFSLAVWLPPKIEKVDLDGLVTKCPLLKATYIETARLYGGGWSASRLNKDVILKDEKVSYVLNKGTYAHILNHLHHSDPKVFPNPNDWQLDRHLQQSGDEKGAAKTANMGSVKSYDGSIALSNDSDLAMRRTLLYTAVILSLYNIEPADGGKWNVSRIFRGPVSARPVRSLRAWVSRRKAHQETSETDSQDE